MQLRLRRLGHARIRIGRPNSLQAGSPLNPGCDYWDNRIVVPLQFTPTGVTCPAGAQERAIIGSQLLINAMASWQPYLCNKIGSTFNFAANPDSVARLQLLDGRCGPRVRIVPDRQGRTR